MAVFSPTFEQVVAKPTFDAVRKTPTKVVRQPAVKSGGCAETDEVKGIKPDKRTRVALKSRIARHLARCHAVEFPVDDGARTHRGEGKRDVIHRDHLVVLWTGRDDCRPYIQKAVTQRVGVPDPAEMRAHREDRHRLLQVSSAWSTVTASRGRLVQCS